ncbi:hypothetical protein D8I24_2139 [Cupriavidus necator H850]|nr:hypothetical protein D8I24_2139 [Cupriavidus necator H850]
MAHDARKKVATTRANMRFIFSPSGTYFDDGGVIVLLSVRR